MKSKLLTFVLFLIFISACRKVEWIQPNVIDLGVKSTSTAIKSIIVSNNVVRATFETTIGAKYSVQIVPFGSEQPVIKEGFTANDVLVNKVYDLSNLPKKNYDLIFIDIEGKEVKFPVTIK